MTIELPHQVRSVRLGCLEGDSQNCRDFLAALALRQKLYDFSFPSGYLRNYFLACLWPFTQRYIHQLLDQFWRKEGPVRQQLLPGFYKITARISLHNTSTLTP